MKKVALITGGNKGIGAAIVKEFHANDFTVIFTFNSDIKAAKQLISEYPDIENYQCDVRDKTKIDKMMESILNKHGAVDVLVNNAGAEKDSTFLKMSYEEWETVLNINIMSIFYVTKPLVYKMVENKWGRIINITSIAGVAGAYGKSNYATAKAGIIGFTKSLAIELASKGITVNAIAPGAIDTDMYKRIPEKYREQIVSNIPCGRIGLPVEVAKLAFYLASDSASYITGQTININGGSYLS